MKRYELEAMTKPDLLAHAEVSGVKCSAEDTKGTIIDRIIGDLPAAKEAAAEDAPRVKLQKDGRDIPLGALFDLQGNRVESRMFELEIFSTEQDKSDVPIIVNGHNIVVKRNHKVIVAEPYVEVLRNAVIETVVQDPDTGVSMPQRIMVFPHSATPVPA